MKAHAALTAICCLPILFGCARDPSYEAARLAAASYRDMAAGKFRDAWTSFQQAVDLRPDVVQYRVGAGKAAAKLGNEAEAAKQYSAAEQILARESQQPAQDVQDHAIVLVLLGRSAEATRVLKEGAERFPGDGNLRYLASHPASFIAGLREYSVGSVEPQGGVNGSQPIRAETNATSGAAGSRPSP